MDAEEAPSLKRVRMGEGLGEATVGASAVGGTREGEGEEGKMMEMEIGSEGSEGTWSLESRFGALRPSLPQGRSRQLEGCARYLWSYHK